MSKFDKGSKLNFWLDCNLLCKLVPFCTTLLKALRTESQGFIGVNFLHKFIGEDDYQWTLVSWQSSSPVDECRKCTLINRGKEFVNFIIGILDHLLMDVHYSCLGTYDLVHWRCYLLIEINMHLIILIFPIKMAYYLL